MIEFFSTVFNALFLLWFIVYPFSSYSSLSLTLSCMLVTCFITICILYFTFLFLPVTSFNSHKESHSFPLHHYTSGLILIISFLTRLAQLALLLNSRYSLNLTATFVKYLRNFFSLQFFSHFILPFLIT